MGLREIRGDINRIDNQILELLSERMVLALEAGKFKEEKGLEIKDLVREKEIVSRMVLLGAYQGLSENFLRPVYEAIVKGCREAQEERR